MARRLAAGVKQLGDLDLAYRVQADPSTSHDVRQQFVDTLPGGLDAGCGQKIRTAVSSPVASHTGTDIAPTWQRLLEHARVPRRAERATLAAIDTATG